MARLIRYGCVGLSVLLVHLASMVIAIELAGLSYGIATWIATSVAAIASYLGHAYITFQVHGGHNRSIPRFLVQIAYTYLASFWIMHFVTSRHWPYLYGAAAIWVILPLLNYITMQSWTFFNPQQEQS